MSVKKEKEITSTHTSARRIARWKHGKYPSKMYGARLNIEDARILDDYGKKHQLKRADLVRYVLHQFAIKQQMSYGVKDPVTKFQEQIISEQITPLKSRLDELTSILNALLKQTSDNHLQVLSSNTGNGLDGSDFSTINNELLTLLEAHFTEQRKMLKRILVATTLGLRLTVNYTVEPVLREVTSKNPGELLTHLQAAEKGREYWSESTRLIVRRTGKRILREYKYLPKEQLNEQQG